MVASSVAVIALVLKDKDRKGVDKQTVRHLQNACEFAYDRTGGDKGVKAAIQHLKDKLKGSEVKASLIKDGDLMKVDDKDLTEAQRAMKKQVVDYFADKYKKKPDYLYIAEIVKDGKSTLVPVFPYARITWPFDK